MAIVASAALLYLAAPGIGNQPWLSFIALWPWLASLRRLSLAPACLSGLLMGLAYIIPGRWQTFATALSASGIEGWALPALNTLFFLSYALPFALFAALDVACRRRWSLSPRLLPLWQSALLATLICGLWTPFAYTPAVFVADYAPLLPMAAWLGEVGLLLLLLWPAAALAQAGCKPSPRWNALLPPLLALLLVMLYGHRQIHQHDQARADGQGLALAALPLQLDLPPNASPRLLDRRRSGTPQSALELSRAGLQAGGPSCELVVWPEVPVDPAAVEQVCAGGDMLARWLGAPLLAQCYRSGENARQITATWFDGSGSPPAEHSKSSLVPLYEQAWWGRAVVEAGPSGTVFALDPQRRLIPTLCYELHSGPQLRDGVLAGGQFIVHMASFTPFGRHPIDAFDLGMARVRAAEYRRPILRAANRGSSGWIDALGRPQDVSPAGARDASCRRLWSPAAAPTPYARIGPLAAWIPGLLVCLLLPLARRQRASPHFSYRSVARATRWCRGAAREPENGAGVATTTSSRAEGARRATATRSASAVGGV